MICNLYEGRTRLSVQSALRLKVIQRIGVPEVVIDMRELLESVNHAVRNWKWGLTEPKMNDVLPFGLNTNLDMILPLIR